MTIKKHILLFLLKFAVIYAVLLLPNMRNAYADFYNTTGQRLFGSFDEKGMVRFKEQNSNKDDDVQTIIYLMNKKEFEENQKTNVPLDVTYIENNWLNDYLPVAFLISLIAATPLGWKRKPAALVAGLLLMHLLLFFSMWISLLWQFHINAERLQVLQLSELSGNITGNLYEILSKNPGTFFLMAVAIWILAVFQRSDWKKRFHQIQA